VKDCTINIIIINVSRHSIFHLVDIFWFFYSDVDFFIEQKNKNMECYSYFNKDI